jgi:hypothetical protein
MNQNAIMKAVVNYSKKRFSKNKPENNVGNLSEILGNNKISNAAGRKIIVDPTHLRVNSVKNQLTNTNSGVFLYMIYYNTLSGKFTTTFNRPNPVFEYGTKHFQMRRKNLENDVIVASGELNIDASGNVVYNMLSGTYMLKILMFYTYDPKPYNRNTMEKFYKDLIPRVLKAQNPFIKKVTYEDTDMVNPILKKKVTLQELTNSGVQMTEIKKRSSR